MSMIESCVVLYLSYLTEDRLLPEYLFAPFIFLQRLCCPGQYKARLEREAGGLPHRHCMSWCGVPRMAAFLPRRSSLAHPITADVAAVAQCSCSDRKSTGIAVHKAA